MDNNFEDPTVVLVINDAGADNEINFRDAVLGIIFCFCVLTTGIYMSHMYSSNERQEIAEEERHRVQAEIDKIKEIETQRIEIAKVINNYAISMTTITSSTTTRTRTLSSSLSSSKNNITIPNGNEDDCNIDEDLPTSTENETTTNRSVISDDTGIIEDIEEQNTNNAKIYFHEEDVDDDQEKEEDDDDEDISSSSIPASTLLKAVANNPCAICLDVFQNDDNIIFCSNNILTGRGGYPHCFHQKCSLDYIVSHTDGLQAPCPCCRKAILCSYISKTDEETGQQRQQQQQEEEEEEEEETVQIPSIFHSQSSVSLTDLVEAAASGIVNTTI
jgi:hypothetical protein